MRRRLISGEANLFTLAPAAIIALLYNSVLVGVLFWVAAISHWVLDLVVHMHDLPVLGFSGKDHKLGFGLWQYPRVAFVTEYIFFATVVLFTAQPTAYVGVLSGGAVPAPPERELVFRVQQTQPLQHTNPAGAHYFRWVYRRDRLVHTRLGMSDRDRRSFRSQKIARGDGRPQICCSNDPARSTHDLIRHAVSLELTGPRDAVRKPISEMWVMR